MEITIRIPDKIAYLEDDNCPDENMEAFYRKIINAINKEINDQLPNTVTGIIIDIVF
jgi:hypothetical protein